MIRFRKPALAIALILLAAGSALAWNQAGHMTTAAIAYDTLKKGNPQALAAILAILHEHPHYEKRWANLLSKVTPEDRDEALFMKAAQWPDDIRDDPDYNHGEWHYIDYPYKPPGQPASVETVPPKQPNIEIAFRTNMDVLKKQDSTNAEKAVALCWLMHLTGDSHQPLHSVTLFTTDFPAPEGDRGGNQEFIRATDGAKPIKLHKFWDDLVISSLDTREVHKKAIELRAKYPREELDKQPKSVTADDFPKWIQESFELAKKDAYQFGKLPMSTTAAKAPVLTAAYVANAKELGERRATLAGYRMADVLGKLPLSAPAATAK
ncbi:MAG TPA: S1/P1 nuclease [Pirellulales bacterium]|jgi:hypothetical protein